MSDEEIKDKNLTRYLNEIAKRLTVDENLKNIKRGAIKILGSNYAGFYAIYTGVGKLSDFMDSIFYVIKESDADYYLTRANNNIQYELSSKNEMNQRILTNTKIIIDRLKSSNSENDKILLSMFEKYQVYLDLVNDYLRNAKMETLRNLEVVKQKLQAIRNMYRNNNSYREIRNVFDNYIDYIARDNTPDRLLNWLRSHGQSAFEEAEVELDDFVETVRELL
jgi:hypothetical protein